MMIVTLRYKVIFIAESAVYNEILYVSHFAGMIATFRHKVIFIDEIYVNNAIFTV